MIRVKICGMATQADVMTCVDAGADALGFIFASSPRRLDVVAASALAAGVPPFVTTVGVFANDDSALVSEAIARCRLDMLQFSGDESPGYCGSFGKPTVIAVRDRNWSTAEIERSRAVALLVDSWSKAEFGGTGRLATPESVSRARSSHDAVHIVLAGGLTPENVADAIAAARPDAVDVRTGVERNGAKDPALVRAFIQAARGTRSRP